MGLQSNKGQISVFIIIGIVLLIIVTLLVFIINGSWSGHPTQSAAPQVDSFVQSCLEQETQQAIILMGAHNSIVINNSFSAPQSEFQYCYDGSYVQKSKEQLQDEVNAYVQEHLNDCIQDFKDLAPEFSITHENPVVEVSFNRRDISAKMKYPLVVRTGSQTHHIDEFNIHFTSKISDILNDSESICKTLEYKKQIPMILQDKQFNEKTYVMPYVG